MRSRWRRATPGRGHCADADPWPPAEILPSGRPGVPVNLASPRKTPSAAKPGAKTAVRSAGRLRIATVRSSVGDTRPFASITPCSSPTRRWSRVTPSPNPMRAGPSKRRFSPFQVACKLDTAATRVMALTVPAVTRRTSPLPGLRISASAFSPNASSGPASSICTEAATPLANFPLATTRELSTGWVSGSTIVVVSSARPVERRTDEPDIVHFDTQICALMPLGFGGDQVGGDGPGNRLADQRTQIIQPRHPQVELSQREARPGCQGKRPLGMSALPVGVLDRDLQPAVAGAGCGERQFERRAHQNALRGDVAGRFAGEAA